MKTIFKVFQFYIIPLDKRKNYANLKFVLKLIWRYGIEIKFM